jgi:hypothetical protein
MSNELNLEGITALMLEQGLITDAGVRTLLNGDPLRFYPGDIVMLANVIRRSAAPSAHKAEPVWISVDEHMPEHDQKVLVAYWPYNNKENKQAVGDAVFLDGAFYTEEGDDHHPPSHWMPLPAIPAAPSTAGEAENG